MTQPTVQPSDDGSIPDETYHCKEPQRMRISELDPSVALVSLGKRGDGVMGFEACLHVGIFLQRRG